MRAFNSKALKKLETSYRPDAPDLHLVNLYTRYQSLRDKQTLLTTAFASMGLTLGFLISKSPVHRYAKLSLYFGLVASTKYYLAWQSACLTESTFKSVTQEVLTDKDLKRMRRAFQIKNAEAEEEKKALKKY